MHYIACACPSKNVNKNIWKIKVLDFSQTMYYLHFWKGKYPYQMECNIMKPLYFPRDVLVLPQNCKQKHCFNKKYTNSKLHSPCHAVTMSTYNIHTSVELPTVEEGRHLRLANAKLWLSTDIYFLRFAWLQQRQPSQIQTDCVLKAIFYFS